MFIAGMSKKNKTIKHASVKVLGWSSVDSLITSLFLSESLDEWNNPL